MDASSLAPLIEALSLAPLPDLTAFPSADPYSRPLDVARVYLAGIFTKVVDNCTSQTAYNAIVPPADIYAGDFAVILPKLLGKGKADWNVVAIELIQKFPPHPLFTLPFSEGVHLRLWVNPDLLYKLFIPYIYASPPTYGFSSVDPNHVEGNKKTSVLEFSSPNLATAFSSRHLRSTLHGIFLSNLHNLFGYPVHKLNYFGDWGKNLALLGVAFSRDTSPVDLSNVSIQQLETLYKQIEEEFRPEQLASKKARDEKTGEEAEIESKGLFKERNEWFAALERGETTQLEFFTRVRELYVEHYTKLYAKLGIAFDTYSGESSIKTETLTKVEDTLKEKGVLDEAEGGSLAVDMKKHGKDKKVKSGMCIIRDRGGSSTYLSRELAGVLERDQMFDTGAQEVQKLMYVVESAHHGVHFSRVQVLLELMGMEGLAAKVQHIGFGEVTGLDNLDGANGDNVLENLLTQARDEIAKSLDSDEEKKAVLQEAGEVDLEKLGVDALLIQEFTSRRASDHIIDVHKAASFESGTALDLIYHLSKLKLITKQNTETEEDKADGTNEVLPNDEQNNLLRLLVQFPDVTWHALKSFEPTGVVAYLTNVAGEVAACLDGNDVDEAAAEGLTPDETEQAAPEAIEQTGETVRKEFSQMELKLFGAARIVMENGLRLLGVRGI